MPWTARGGRPASPSASTAASANSSAHVRSCLPNFVTPTPTTATLRMRPPFAQLIGPAYRGSDWTPEAAPRPAVLFCHIVSNGAGRPPGFEGNLPTGLLRARERIIAEREGRRSPHPLVAASPVFPRLAPSVFHSERRLCRRNPLLGEVPEGPSRPPPARESGSMRPMALLRPI